MGTGVQDMSKQDKIDVKKDIKETVTRKGNEVVHDIQISVPEGVDVKDIEKVANSSILRDVNLDYKDLKHKIDSVVKIQEQEILQLGEVIKAKKNVIFEMEKISKEKFEKKTKRWKFHHKVVKRIVQKVIPFLLKRFNPYIVKNIHDFKPEWYNNLIRIWYWSEHKGIDDMWVYMHREMNPQWKQRYKTPTSYLKGYVPWRYGNSDKWTRAIVDLWATEVIEDSIDREIRNMAVLNQTHEVMKLFGVSEQERNKVPRPGEFPVWNGPSEHNPMFFLQNMDQPVWEEPEPFDYDKEEQDKLKEMVKDS